MPRTKTTTRREDDLTLLSVNEVADTLGVSSRTVWSLLACGLLQRVKVGRMTRIRRSEIRAFVEQGGADFGGAE